MCSSSFGYQTRSPVRIPAIHTAATFVPTGRDGLRAIGAPAPARILTSLAGCGHGLVSSTIQISPTLYDPAALKLAALLPKSHRPLAASRSFGLNYRKG
jgi:hypothetical protein